MQTAKLAPVVSASSPIAGCRDGDEVYRVGNGADRFLVVVRRDTTAPLGKKWTFLEQDGSALRPQPAWFEMNNRSSNDLLRVGELVRVMGRVNTAPHTAPHAEVQSLSA